MHPKLSIIIPCYNCEKTVEESVNSIYRQNLVIPFEIVMVNDSSTDNTQEVLNTLSKKYPEVKVFGHEKNKGGGATRNTAVSKTLGEIIFCFDSDDILIDNTLNKMLQLLEEKKCDGITFSGGLSFKTDPLKNTPYTCDFDLSKPIELIDYFSGIGGGVESNFMYTKKAFDISGGYPVHHNFDTQGFGKRFLLKGLRAYVSPNTSFYHRQFSGPYSYFERAYNTGELSIGQFLINIEILHLLSEEIKKELFSFNIFNNNILGKSNLSDFLIKKYKESPETFFIPNYKTYLKENGTKEYIEKYPNDILIQANHDFKSKDYKSASEKYSTLISKSDIPSINLYFLFLFADILSTNKNLRLNNVIELLGKLQAKTIASTKTRNNIMIKIINKIINTLTNIKEKII